MIEGLRFEWLNSLQLGLVQALNPDTEKSHIVAKDLPPGSWLLPTSHRDVRRLRIKKSEIKAPNLQPYTTRIILSELLLCLRLNKLKVSTHVTCCFRDFGDGVGLGSLLSEHQMRSVKSLTSVCAHGLSRKPDMQADPEKVKIL